MRRPSFLGWAILAGCILLVSLLVFKRYLPYVGSSLAPAQPPAVVLEMRNTYFVGLNHKGKLWSIRAKKVEIGQNRYVTTLTDISDGKIFESGKPVLGVKAGRAMYNSMVGGLALDRGIRITGPDGQQVITSGADWNSTTGALRSRGKVQYKSPFATASTDDILVDMKNKEITMHKVSGSLNLSGQGAAISGF